MIPGTVLVLSLDVFNFFLCIGFIVVQHADINVRLGTPDDGWIQPKHVVTAFVI
jgi:hypothetical protein